VANGFCRVSQPGTPGRGIAGTGSQVRGRARVAALACALSCSCALTLALAAAAGAATYTVNTTADSPPAAPGCAGGAGSCSLRQALERSRSGDVVAVPASNDVYVLANGPIGVRGGVTINGAGAGATTISGGGTEQAFNLEGASAGTPPATITGMTITDTVNSSGHDQGGAINAEATEPDPLVLEDVLVSHSHSGAPSGYGGAIEINSSLTIRHSRFFDDTVTTGGGGAIEFAREAGTLTISDSAFTGDTTSEASGGAILVENRDTVTISSSTFSGDVAGGGWKGGAVELYPNTNGTIENSTFTGNAAGEGGAIFNEGKTLLLLADTIAGDAAVEGANVGAKPLSVTTLENSIIATPSGGGTNCLGKIVSEGHNLEDASPSSCGLRAALGDLIGVDPQLSSLAVNASIDPTAGGPPGTLALSRTSAAVGAGSPSLCSELGSVDERGFPRPGVEGGTCDIGAYELLPPAPTETTLSASSPGTGAGRPVTFTATVATGRPLPATVPAAGGLVEFRDGSEGIGTAPVLAGAAALTVATLAPGGHDISAVYLGDFVHAPSSSSTVAESVAPEPPAPALPAPPLPLLTGLRQAHSRWREGSALAAIARARRLPRGTAFSFTLNTPASVTLSFSRLLPGRMLHGRCAAASRSDRRHRRCAFHSAAGRLVFVAAAGASRVSFQGRISRSRRLGPGRYLVSIVARNARGSSAARVLAFTITRG
jgi:hypothetical protein